MKIASHTVVASAGALGTLALMAFLLFPRAAGPLQHPDPRTASSAEPPPRRAHAFTPDPVPEFPDGLEWLNSRPLRMRDLRGKVVLIDFWEYTCVNCIRTFPYLKAWQERYRDKGLVLIGVHTPEFRFARLRANVAKAAADFGLTWPLALDSDYQVWNAYGNRFWPAKYLIDGQGRIRHVHFGEGAYSETEAQIQSLLWEINPRVELPPILEPVRGTDRPGARCYPATPELYLGYERGGPEGTLGNPEGYQPGRTVTYRDPGRHQDGTFYLNGAWRNLPQAVMSVRRADGPRDWIATAYHALEVNIVVRPELERPVRVWVLQDGKPVARADRGEAIRYTADGRSYVVVDRARMYNLVKNAAFGHRELKLVAQGPGLGVYTFTFVSCTVDGG
ncbi:MAG: redoxin domain-containing protein [Armatimonadetes bacterium]|nr:redoxin domain-containing protein [Armatimonadota bacterium]